MKYKVGDRVRIREDLQPNVEYEGDYFIPDMGDFKGEIATVIKVYGDGYRINEDGGDWKWTDKMFEPVEFTKADLKPGDILTCRDGTRASFDSDRYILIFGENGKHLLDDLTNTNKLGSDLDIVKVERPQIIWERPEEKTNEELHREMWNWLAENPEKSKKDWLEDNGYTGDKYLLTGDKYLLNECFACDECGGHCSECPLDERVIRCDGGLFNAWWNTTDMDTKSRLADVIANLPWRRNDEKC